MFIKKNDLKNKALLILALVASIVVMGMTNAQLAHSAGLQVEASAAASMGTGFSYQGQLSDNGAAATGSYDFSFQFMGVTNDLLLPVGVPVIVNNVAVADGLFVTKIDGGPSLFNGERRFLQVSVRQTGEADFAQIGGPTEILPAPYALFAAKAAEAVKLADPGETVVHAGHFGMMQSDGQTDVTFAARGNGRMEMTRPAGGLSDEFLYIPVDVPSQVLGSGQKLKTLSFCYSGVRSNELGVLAGIQQAGVRQMNKMVQTNVLFEDFTPGQLADEDSCVNVTTDNPQTVEGSLWVRFKVTAGPSPLAFGEVKLTFVSE